MQQHLIRNFSIIAHIDHGKSTLADRFLEVTKTVESREMKEQLLDQMDLERERGITIKMQPVNMIHKSNGTEYALNLIDTPGHSDFSYEVSRALQAVEGALVLVDATQGIEAQTISNVELALAQDLVIIPVINKIDLPNADREKVVAELVSLLGIKEEEVFYVSAKTGEGVPELLEGIVERIPAPKGNENASPRALVFDSFYDPYRGVRASIRVIDGAFSKKNTIRTIRNGEEERIVAIGTFKPKLTPQEELSCGMTGYIETGFKSIADCRVGDTITISENPSENMLAGYAEPQPKVFAGIFLTDGQDVHVLTQALEKLQLNDAALTFSPIHSDALGFGHRLGLLGLLHLEIIAERLQREFGLGVIIASPSVSYEVEKKGGERVELHSPSELPPRQEIELVFEPWSRIEIVTQMPYMGKVMDLCKGRRAIFKNNQQISEAIISLTFEIPLAEIIADFYDRLKSVTSGYASFSYEILDFRAADLVKLDILVNGDSVDALSTIIPRENAVKRGKEIIDRLKTTIPRRQFQIPLQAAISEKIIARTNIPPMRKDVTAKLYGGDVTRKRKLLEKQKQGKQRLKDIGGVEIPQEAFLSVLKGKEDA